MSTQNINPLYFSVFYDQLPTCADAIFVFFGQSWFFDKDAGCHQTDCLINMFMSAMSPRQHWSAPRQHWSARRTASTVLPTFLPWSPLIETFHCFACIPFHAWFSKGLPVQPACWWDKVLQRQFFCRIRYDRTCVIIRHCCRCLITVVWTGTYHDGFNFVIWRRYAAIMTTKTMISYPWHVVTETTFYRWAWVVSHPWPFLGVIKMTEMIIMITMMTNMALRMIDVMIIYNSSLVHCQ